MTPDEIDPLLEQSRPDTYWTTTNISEAIPGVVTPLTWTLWGPRMDLGSRRAYARLGILSRAEAAPEVPVDRRFSAIFYGRPALNVDFVRVVADRAPGTSGPAAEEQLLGSIRPGVPANPSSRRLPIIVARLPYGFLRTARGAHTFLEEQRGWWLRSTTGVGPETPRERLVEAGKRLEAALALHSVCSMLAVALLDQVGALAKAADRVPLATVLGTGQGDVEEAQFVSDLWELSRGRLTQSEVLARHGFQGPGELSLHSYRADPAQVAGLAERYADRPESESPTTRALRQHAAREAAEREVLAALPASRRPGARLVFRLARGGIPLREVGKAAYVMALDAARAAARDRFAELESRGWLASPDDVFALTFDELIGPDRDFRGLADERNARYREYCGLELPRSWYGQPEPVRATGAGSESGALVGIPVYAGVVVGPVRVALTIAEAASIEPGEILVCSTTDPYWSSVFPLVAGLAIDVGSGASHGAIVARELGIPCVINTITGTQALRTGEVVRLDGAAGTVERLSGGIE